MKAFNWKAKFTPAQLAKIGLHQKTTYLKETNNGHLIKIMAEALVQYEALLTEMDAEIRDERERYPYDNLQLESRV